MFKIGEFTKRIRISNRAGRQGDGFFRRTEFDRFTGCRQDGAGRDSVLFCPFSRMQIR